MLSFPHSSLSFLISGEYSKNSAPMKNLSTLLIAITLSVGTVHAVDRGPGNPSPVKQADSTTFELSKNYFSLFNLLIFENAQTDTIRIDQFLRDRRIEPLRRPR